ncbi:lipopolysaccharide cholinephosphotransferase [Lachnospiraceae bacterium]|nr:lipopolysaccharide cholinephosphotransferase [Lachnospiraceae bacterium]
MKTTFRQYEDDELNKLHHDMLFVLNKLDELCKKHDISYFAVAGTLLGAVRHKGYIPWDDDLDLGMLIDDYDKFLQIPPEEYEEFGLYALEKNPEDYYSFVTKFYYKDSKFISPIAKADGRDNMGIFVEIFPFYDLPDDKKKIRNMYFKAEILKALFGIASCKRVIVFGGGIKGTVKKIVKLFIRNLLKVFRLDSLRLAGMYDKMCRRYTGKYNNYVGSFCDVFSMYKKSWLSGTKEVKFEDSTIQVPTGGKYYLKNFYGDNYMELPPENKRWNQAAEYIRFIDGSELNQD